MQIKNKHTHRHTRAYTWGACKKGVKTVLPKKLCTTKQKRAARKPVWTKTFSSNCIPSNVPQGSRVHSRIVVVCNWFDAFCSFFCVYASVCLHFLEYFFVLFWLSKQPSQFAVISDPQKMRWCPRCALDCGRIAQKPWHSFFFYPFLWSSARPKACGFWQLGNSTNPSAGEDSTICSCCTVVGVCEPKTAIDCWFGIQSQRNDRDKCSITSICFEWAEREEEFPVEKGNKNKRDSRLSVGRQCIVADRKDPHACPVPCSPCGKGHAEERSSEKVYPLLSSLDASSSIKFCLCFQISLERFVCKVHTEFFIILLCVLILFRQAFFLPVWLECFEKFQLQCAWHCNLGRKVAYNWIRWINSTELNRLIVLPLSGKEGRVSSVARFSDGWP